MQEEKTENYESNLASYGPLTEAMVYRPVTWTCNGAMGDNMQATIKQLGDKAAAQNIGVNYRQSDPACSWTAWTFVSKSPFAR